MEPTKVDAVENQVAEGFRLSPQQRHIWHFDPDSARSYTQCTLEVQGAVDLGALEVAASSVFGRYQVLRTGFRLLASVNVPVQVIEEVPRYAFEQVDWSNDSPMKQQAAIADLRGARGCPRRPTCAGRARAPLHRHPRARPPRRRHDGLRPVR